MLIFSLFLQMMNSMGGEDLPDLDGIADEVCMYVGIVHTRFCVLSIVNQNPPLLTLTTFCNNLTSG